MSLLCGSCRWLHEPHRNRTCFHNGRAGAPNRGAPCNDDSPACSKFERKPVATLDTSTCYVDSEGRPCDHVIVRPDTPIIVQVDGLKFGLLIQPGVDSAAVQPVALSGDKLDRRKKKDGRRYVAFSGTAYMNDGTSTVATGQRDSPPVTFAFHQPTAPEISKALADVADRPRTKVKLSTEGGIVGEAIRMMQSMTGLEPTRAANMTAERFRHSLGLSDSEAQALLIRLLSHAGK